MIKNHGITTRGVAGIDLIDDQGALVERQQIDQL